jgi:hypothetical protein
MGQYLRYLEKKGPVFDRQSKDELMATSITGLSIPVLAPPVPSTAVRARRRRYITPEAGHALEILGHAIEYLTDEFLHEGGSLSASDPRLEAVHLLMARNREIYLACPEVAGFGERIRSIFH